MNFFNFYSKSNSFFKGTLLFLLFILIIFLFNLFNLGFNSSLFWTLIFVYITILALVFPEGSPEFGKNMFILIFIFLIGVMLFAWLKGGNIPYTNIPADNSAMVTIFTIILAIATIVNVITYKQAIGFSRLSELDFHLNKILCIEIDNIGNYPARGIKLTTRIIDKDKSKGWVKRKFVDLFTSPEFRKHYLPSKGGYAERLKDHLEKRFNLIYDEIKEKHTSIKKKSFNMMLTLNYRSDTYFKNPLPIVKEYEIQVDSNGMTKREVKPSS